MTKLGVLETESSSYTEIESSCYLKTESCLGSSPGPDNPSNVANEYYHVDQDLHPSQRPNLAMLYASNEGSVSGET